MTNLNQESNSEFRIQNSELKDNSEFKFEVLAKYIEIVDTNFRSLAQKQVNISYTVRNWFIGYYILSYEQKGKDRAEYGTNIIGNLSKLLKDRGLKGFSITNLMFLIFQKLIVRQEVEKHQELSDYQRYWETHILITLLHLKILFC